jgi:hypothetical protein
VLLKLQIEENTRDLPEKLDGEISSAHMPGDALLVDQLQCTTRFEMHEINYISLELVELKRV